MSEEMNDAEIMADTESRIAHGQIHTMYPQGLLHYLQWGNETPNPNIRKQILQIIYAYVTNNAQSIRDAIDTYTMELNEKNKHKSALDAIIRGYQQNTFNKGDGSKSFKTGGKKSRRQKSRKSRRFRRSRKARR